MQWGQEGFVGFVVAAVDIKSVGPYLGALVGLISVVEDTAILFLASSSVVVARKEEEELEDFQGICLDFLVRIQDHHHHHHRCILAGIDTVEFGMEVAEGDHIHHHHLRQDKAVVAAAVGAKMGNLRPWHQGPCFLVVLTWSHRHDLLVPLHHHHGLFLIQGRRFPSSCRHRCHHHHHHLVVGLEYQGTNSTGELFLAVLVSIRQIAQNPCYPLHHLRSWSTLGLGPKVLHVLQRRGYNFKRHLRQRTSPAGKPVAIQQRRPVGLVYYMEDDQDVIGDDLDVVHPSRPSTYPPHHAFNQGLSAMVRSMQVRHKRQIYVSMRHGTLTPESFFPQFGMNAAEFTTFQILNENPRRAATTSSAVGSGTPLTNASNTHETDQDGAGNGMSDEDDDRNDDEDEEYVKKPAKRRSGRLSGR